MSFPRGIDTNNDVSLEAWQHWKRNGILFAGIKATEGTGFVSPAFTGNWRLSHVSEIGRIAYHYGHPGDDPARQAEHFAAIVKAAGMRKGEVLALDLEVTDGLPPAEVSFWAWVFMTELQRLCPDAKLKVYTFESFASAGNCARLGAWPLWIADWDVASPFVPPPWKTWRIWQYASGTLTDHDLFHGTETEAREFFLLPAR